MPALAACLPLPEIKSHVSVIIQPCLHLSRMGLSDTTTVIYYREINDNSYNWKWAGRHWTQFLKVRTVWICLQITQFLPYTDIFKSCLIHVALSWAGKTFTPYIALRNWLAALWVCEELTLLWCFMYHVVPEAIRLQHWWTNGLIQYGKSYIPVWVQMNNLI